MTEIFDKILEKHKEELSEVFKLGWSSGIKYERQRIIKLLENHINHFGKDSWLDAIELIKGEQK
jgi:hypothetical protein